VWIPGPDRRIRDVEGPGRFKAEAPLVARVSENEDDWPTRPLGPLEQLLHKRRSNPGALMSGLHRQWSDRHDRVTAEIAHVSQHMSNDQLTVVRDEVESGGDRVPLPRL